MKKFLVLAFLFITLSLPAAGFLHCRSGSIIAAQITTANLKITNFTGHGFRLPISDKRAYAVVTIKPSDMRVISIFDYSLELSGVPFPCVAVWKQNHFEYTVNDVQSTQPVQILFIIDKEMLIGSSTINAIIKSNFSTAKDVYSVTVPFSVIGSRTPFAPGQIPAAGILELPEK